MWLKKRVVSMKIKLSALERFDEGGITVTYAKKMTWKSKQQTHTQKRLDIKELAENVQLWF